MPNSFKRQLHHFIFLREMHKCSREGFNTIPTIESPLPILGLQLCPNPGPAIHLESQACGTLGSQSGSLYFVLQKRVHAVRPHSVASLAHTPPWFHLAHANCFLIPFPPVTVPVNDSVSAVILKAVKEDDSPVGTRMKVLCPQSAAPPPWTTDLQH